MPKSRRNPRFHCRKRVWIPVLLTGISAGYLLGAIPTVVVLQKTELMEVPAVESVARVVYGPLEWLYSYSPMARQFFDSQREVWDPD